MVRGRPLPDRLGASLRLFGAEFLYGCGFFLQVMKELFRFFRKGQTGYRVLVMQILFTGFEALWVVSVLSLALGTLIIIQGMSLLPQFGQGRLMYELLVIIITRELGPMLTAFIIIARSGTAIATELAGMVVNHEVEAYMAFGINPFAYLVVPRVIGVTLSMVILTVYFSLFGLLGSWFIGALFTPLPFDEYVSTLLSILKPGDIGISLLKAFSFGFIVALISCYQGFSVHRASTEVPVAGIRAVSACFVWCILANAVLTLLYYW